MRVRLNLATKALETHRRFLAGASLTAVVAGVLFLLLGWHVYSVRKINAEDRARREKIGQEMRQIEAQRRELEAYFSQKDIASLQDRADFINAILDASSFDWTKMFMDLERILPPGVRVISIEPKQARGGAEVKMKVGAVSDDAALKFQRALEESKEFREVRVQNIHAPSQTGTPSTDAKIVELTTIYSRI